MFCLLSVIVNCFNLVPPFLKLFLKLFRNEMNFEDDTIVALATPAGVGAISVIRVSGPESISTVDKIFDGKHKLSDSSTHTIHYGKIIDENKELIDDVLVSIFKKPNSYTGEESVEISTHGSSLITQKIIQTLLKQNIRLAEPGEFTKRAFLNGRIDLAQAEAVFDIIKAKTEESLKAAVNQLKGGLSKKMELIAEALKNICAGVEANIEFAEEEIETTGMSGVKKELQKTLKEINALLATAEGGKMLREGIKTAIIGKPNAGKSSLLNELLDEERAIVTHIPGTTRDVIEETINIEGIAFVLSDTAGIREAKDLVERKGIERSIIAIDEADLLLAVFDGATKIEKEDLEIINKIKGKNIIAVINKTDLKPAKTTEKEVKKLISASIVKISLLNKTGIEKLKKEMGKIALEKGARSKESLIITNVRHKELLSNAADSIKKAIESINKKMSEEFIALDIRGALDYIGSVTGRVSTDDILNKIFSDFCIGK